jgi:hypothetical protein
MDESIRWARKIGKGILTDQNKKKGNKNREGFLSY